MNNIFITFYVLLVPSKFILFIACFCQSNCFTHISMSVNVQCSRDQFPPSWESNWNTERDLTPRRFRQMYPGAVMTKWNNGERRPPKNVRAYKDVPDYWKRHFWSNQQCRQCYTTVTGTNRNPKFIIIWEYIVKLRQYMCVMCIYKECHTYQFLLQSEQGTYR